MLQIDKIISILKKGWSLFQGLSLKSGQVLHSLKDLSLYKACLHLCYPVGWSSNINKHNQDKSPQTKQ